MTRFTISLIVASLSIQVGCSTDTDDKDPGKETTDGYMVNDYGDEFTLRGGFVVTDIGYINSGETVVVLTTWEDPDCSIDQLGSLEEGEGYAYLYEDNGSPSIDVTYRCADEPDDGCLEGIGTGGNGVVVLIDRSETGASGTVSVSEPGWIEVSAEFSVKDCGELELS